MKRNFILATVVMYSALFFACEEDAIPVPLPPPLPVAQTTDNSEPPPSDSIASPVAVDNSPVKAHAPSNTVRKVTPIVEETESGQLKTGRYTIQIVLFPSEASAKKLVKKMAENGISAYYAKVNNPDSLYGTYYRVRVGYFNGISAATAFARTRLAPLGYSWWVDNTRNDTVPKPGTSSKSTVYLDPELERAKQEYKEFAKAADKDVAKQQQAPPSPPEAPVKVPPPPPPPPK